jgi:hypothetical protein
LRQWTIASGLSHALTMVGTAPMSVMAMNALTHLAKTD